MRKVVVNTTPLIALSHVEQLGIKKSCTGKGHISFAGTDCVVFRAGGRAGIKDKKLMVLGLLGVKLLA